MISLVLPGIGAKYYVAISQTLIGPFSAQGPSDADSQSVSFRSTHDTLSQGTEYFHEKDVNHVQHSGSVTYLPQMSDVTRTPTSLNPYSLQFRYKNFNGSGNYVMNCDNGLPHEMELGLHVASSSRTWRQCVNSSPSQFVWLELTYDPSRSLKDLTYMPTIYKYTYTFKRTSGSTIYYDFREDSRKVFLGKFVSTWEELKGSMLNMIFLDMPPTFNRTLVDLAFAIVMGYSTPSLSVASVQSYLESNVIPSLDGTSIPLAEKDYGTLAGEASQKVNANKTNMIAFLRDLRHPQEMIPKLQALKSLKAAKQSSNYLSVHYGLLPTISDLKVIAGAFQRILPYLDRNGFETFTSVHTVNGSSGVTTSTTTQRLKLAVDNDDSKLQALARKVESMGFALTFENVWDLLPYSFVVDWFIDIGGFLERADSRLRIISLDIQYVTMSRKNVLSTQVSPTQLYPLTGNIQRVAYSRWTTDQCPLPPIFSQSTPTVSNHWLEASALILQRQKY